MDKFNYKQNAVRALAVLLPAIMLGSFYVKAALPLLIAVLFSLVVAWLFAQYVEVQNQALYSAILILVLCYCFASYRAFLALLIQGVAVLPNLYKVFIASGVYALLSFGVLLPAWLIFFGLDHFFIKLIRTNKVPFVR